MINYFRESESHVLGVLVGGGRSCVLQTPCLVRKCAKPVFGCLTNSANMGAFFIRNWCHTQEM